MFRNRNSMYKVESDLKLRKAAFATLRPNANKDQAKGSACENLSHKFAVKC